MSKNEFSVLCIRCPRGCELHIRKKSEEIEVKGYGCQLGKEYGRKEACNPKRVVSSTVRIMHARYPRLPVRTKEAIPKHKIQAVIRALEGVTVKAPVSRGAVILEEIVGTGVPVIAERNMEAIHQ